MKKLRGFTLVELMITLVIAAILLTLGVPSFTNLTKNNRLVTDANLFVASINIARSEAVKRRRNASVCVSTTYAGNPPTCTGGSDWSNGWVVWVDNDSDGAIDADEVVTVYEPLDTGVSFTSTGKSSFTYSPNGLVDGLDSLTLCDDRTGETGRSIDISATGRPAISNIVCG